MPELSDCHWERAMTVAAGDAATHPSWSAYLTEQAELLEESEYVYRGDRQKVLALRFAAEFRKDAEEIERLRVRDDRWAHDAVIRTACRRKEDERRRRRAESRLSRAVDLLRGTRGWIDHWVEPELRKLVDAFLEELDGQ